VIAPIYPGSVDRRGMFIPIVLAAATLAFFANPMLVISVAVVLGLAWLGWRYPAVGVGIVAATIPVQEAFLFSIGTFEATATQLTVLPLVVGWFAAWLVKRNAVSLTPVVIGFALVTAAMALSVINAVDRGEWAKEVYRWAIALALLMIVSSCVRRVRDAWPVVIGIAAGIMFSFGIAIAQVIADDGPPSFSTGRFMRAYGYFGEPNPLAAYLEMSLLLLVPLALVMLTTRSNPVAVRYGLAVVTVSGAVALLLTQSRGGLLGFAAGCAVIAFLYARWSRQLLLVGVLVALPLLLLTTPGRNVVNRLSSSVATVRIDEQTTSSNWSVHERLAHWRAGTAMFETEPAIGIGAGNFDVRFREHTSVWRFRIPRGHAHNGLIQIAAQTGLVGLVSYLALFFMAGARIARGVANAQCAPARAMALGAMGVLIAVAVHGQFDYLHGLSLNLAFVIALAMTEPAINGVRNVVQRNGAIV
jgi:O-antigen ligase